MLAQSDPVLFPSAMRGLRSSLVLSGPGKDGEKLEGSSVGSYSIAVSKEVEEAVSSQCDGLERILESAQSSVRRTEATFPLPPLRVGAAAGGGGGGAASSSSSYSSSSSSSSSNPSSKFSMGPPLPSVSSSSSSSSSPPASSFH